jgi:hypothetical protein
LVGRRLLGVLAAVEFYAEFCLAAGEIDDEGDYDKLTGEGWSIAGDEVPDRQFCRRGIIA